MESDALRVFLRVALAAAVAALIAAILTDSDRTLTGMAGMAATGAAILVHIWRGPGVGS